MIDGGATEPFSVPPRAPAISARDAVQELRRRIGQSVLSQDHLVESMLIGLLANGNLLIESLPAALRSIAAIELGERFAAIPVGAPAVNEPP
jgi:MoxR-like ATPase